MKLTIVILTIVSVLTSYQCLRQRAWNNVITDYAVATLEQTRCKVGKYGYIEWKCDYSRRYWNKYEKTLREYRSFWGEVKRD